MSKKCVVTGAGGAIGGHLVRRLLDEGNEVVAIDKKPTSEWWQTFPDALNKTSTDLSDFSIAKVAIPEADELYALAADMGGMGFISNHRVDCLHSVDITSATFRAAARNGVDRLFQASSACVYPDYKQQVELVSLKESDAWPADPEPAYGLEKLYGEEFCKWYADERLLETRVARYHNVYATDSTWNDGREKAPAAICRKVAIAAKYDDNDIEIWGDGEQTRSFMYVDDCIEGTLRIMRSDYTEPLNLGSDELVSINQLVNLVEGIAGARLNRTYNLDAPQGVRGRNSDNTLIRSTLGWEPSISLQDGLERLYAWIYDQI